QLIDHLLPGRSFVRGYLNQSAALFDIESGDRLAVDHDRHGLRMQRRVHADERKNCEYGKAAKRPEEQGHFHVSRASRSLVSRVWGTSGGATTHCAAALVIIGSQCRSTRR